jgi:hypothetical protein
VGAAQNAQRRRCRKLLNGARDIDEMRALADTPACSASI